MHTARLLACAALGLSLLTGTNASAADFTISKDISAGTFTFTDTNPSAPVFEIVVSGTGLTAGTTRPGFSASTILFGTDPQNCLPVLGSTITSGFCYKLTDTTQGGPITTGNTTFTYDSSFDSIDPSDFAVAFNLPNNTVGACFGNTVVGCSAPNSVPVPEPGSSAILLCALLTIGGLRTMTGRRLTAARLSA
ncbi:MAG: hypothetical protein ACRYF2_11205 [Janthinobacterium lividum]